MRESSQARSASYAQTNNTSTWQHHAPTVSLQLAALQLAGYTSKHASCMHQCIHLREQRNSLALHLAEYTSNARVAVFADINAYIYVNNNADKVNTNIKLLCER